MSAHVSLFDDASWQTLLEEDDAVRVTCYLPMVRAGSETRQNPIRFKNILRYAHQALLERGLDKREAASLVRTIQDAVPDDSFWEHQQEGLAVFATADDCRMLSLSRQFAPSVTVAPRFHVIPLLPAVHDNRRFLVLALSQDRVRLIRASRDRAEELDPGDGVPRSLTAVVGSQLEEQSLQTHTSTTGAAAFHSHGEGDDDRLPELERYCRAVADALAAEPAVLDAPLVLAADVRLAAIFRAVARRLRLLEDGIDGNHDRTPPDRLRDLAWPAVAARIAAEEAALVQTFHAQLGAGRASDDIDEIREAADRGRVESLLLSREDSLPQNSDFVPDADPDGGPDSSGVGSEPPVNADAVATLRNGGSVHVLASADMPTRAPVAAIFRF